MKVLVACEYSGIVREAFSAFGCDAWSCDLLPTEIPGNHYQGDVFDIINDGWDLMIAHPPCTYLSVAGNRHIPGNPERWKKRYEALLFVYDLWSANIPHIAIENPVSVLSSYLRKPDQIVQPYYFGDNIPKKTCLWLKGLPKLIHSECNHVEPEFTYYNSKKTNQGKVGIQFIGLPKNVDHMEGASSSLE